MNDVRCLVLGGRGFIGSHLVDALLSEGFKVRCFDRPHIALPNYSHLYNANLELMEGDFCSKEDLNKAVQDCDICFHLVSTTLPSSSNLNPIYDAQSNLIGTLQLLDECVKSKLQKIVFISSGGTVYGNPLKIPISEHHPTNPTCSYGITKLAIEKYLSLYQQLHGLDYTIIRLANPFGDRQRLDANQGAVAVFFGHLLKDKVVNIWGDGSVVRDYIYISDVIDAILTAAHYRGTEKVFNIGSGEGYSLNEVLAAIEDTTSLKTRCKYNAARNFDVPVSILDIQKAEEFLGWKPKISFRQGLSNFYTWIKLNH